MWNEMREMICGYIFVVIWLVVGWEGVIFHMYIIIIISFFEKIVNQTANISIDSAFVDICCGLSLW